MTDISKRLRASVGSDAINKNSFERSICKRQMLEAADAIDRLEKLLEGERQHYAGVRVWVGNRQVVLGTTETAIQHERVRGAVLTELARGCLEWINEHHQKGSNHD